MSAITRKLTATTEETSSICSICKEEFSEGEEQLSHVGGEQHGFHKDCLVTWLKTNPICPLDRQAIDISSIQSRTERLMSALSNAAYASLFGGIAATVGTVGAAGLAGLAGALGAVDIAARIGIGLAGVAGIAGTIVANQSTTTTTQLHIIDGLTRATVIAATAGIGGISKAATTTLTGISLATGVAAAITERVAPARAQEATRAARLVTQATALATMAASTGFGSGLTGLAIAGGLAIVEAAVGGGVITTSLTQIGVNRISRQNIGLGIAVGGLTSAAICTSFASSIAALAIVPLVGGVVSGALSLIR